MPQFITIGGKPFITPGGVAILKHDPTAPNGVDFGETITIREAVDGSQYVTIDLPVADYSAYDRLNIIFKGTTDAGTRVSAPFSLKPIEAGVTNIGDTGVILGSVGNVSSLQYQIVPVSSDEKFGSPLDPVDVEYDSDVITQVPQITNNVITGTGIVGDVHTVNYTITGNPTPTVSLQWNRNGTPISGETSSTYIPVSADDGTTLTCYITASNTEGDDESTSNGISIVEQFIPDVATVSISGSGNVNSVHAATYTVNNAGVPVADVTYQWKMNTVDINGATSSSYTPVSSGDLTVAVTLTNIVGSDSLTSSIKTISSGTTLTAPDITAASITGGNAAGTTHGLSITVTGNPTPTLSYQWKLNGGNVSGATFSTYVSPANSTASLTCTIVATNSQGTDSFTTDGITLVPVQPLAVDPADWDFATTNVIDGEVKLETIRIKLNRSAVGAQAITSAIVDDALAPFEDLTLLSNDGTWQTWRVNNWDSGGTTRDFRIFDPTTYPGDEARAGRLAVRIKTASDVWSPRSSVKQITLDYPDTEPNDLFTYGDFIPLHHRTREQYIGNGTASNPQPGPAGNGHQFWRSYGYSPDDPDFIFCGMDVSIPMLTRDFGGWWEHPSLNGLKAGRSVQSIAIDSEDSNRVILMYGNASLRGSAGSLNGWDDVSGLYLSTDRGKNCALTYNIKSLGGSNANQAGENVTRFMQHCIVEVPGGTPSTREWWAVAHQMPLGSNTTGIQIVKSTTGGSSWTSQGTLNVGTFDMPLVMRRAANGDWWLGTKNGLFKSTTNPAGSWTNITSTTNLPDGFITEIDVKGATNEVWVSVRGDGLYKTTNGGTSWTEVYNYDIETFAISPHNRNIILIAGDNGQSPQVFPKKSTNGGSSWTNIINNPFPGQANDFESFIQSDQAYYIFHATDPNKVFAARFQHHGLSNDAGSTFNWSSANYDYNYVYGIGIDPTDWTSMLKAMTDRIIMIGVDCDKYVIENTDGTINNSFKTSIGNALGAGAKSYIGSGRGALILRNGSHVIYVSGLGDNSNRVPYYMKKVSDANPLANATQLTYYGAQGCNNGINTPGNNTIGYIGRNRITLNSNGTVSQKDMGKECVGIDSGGNVYAIDKSGSNTVYKCTNPTTSGTITWTSWANLGYSPDVARISYDPTKANGRLLFGCGSGRFVLAENGSARVVGNVSNILGAGFPGYLTYSCALDPTSDAAYVVCYAYGGGGVFKTSDITQTTPTWTNISTAHSPNCPNHVFVHPTTGDLFSMSNSGNYIYPAHSAQANSYYDEVWNVLIQYQI